MITAHTAPQMWVWGKRPAAIPPQSPLSVGDSVDPGAWGPGEGCGNRNTEGLSVPPGVPQGMSSYINATLRQTQCAASLTWVRDALLFRVYFY